MLLYYTILLLVLCFTNEQMNIAALNQSVLKYFNTRLFLGTVLVFIKYGHAI